jgi:hypothetical protein
MVTKVTSADNLLSNHSDTANTKSRGRHSKHLDTSFVHSLRLNRTALVTVTSETSYASYFT